MFVVHILHIDAGQMFAKYLTDTGLQPCCQVHGLTLPCHDFSVSKEYQDAEILGEKKEISRGFLFTCPWSI